MQKLEEILESERAWRLEHGPMIESLGRHRSAWELMIQWLEGRGALETVRDAEMVTGVELHLEVQDEEDEMTMPSGKYRQTALGPRPGLPADVTGGEPRRMRVVCRGCGRWTDAPDSAVFGSTGVLVCSECGGRGKLVSVRA